MNTNVLKTTSLIVCILMLFLCIYAPISDAWWGKAWKCIKAAAIFTAATTSMIIACGATIASIIIDGGTIGTLVLSGACLASIAYWHHTKKQYKKYC